MGTGKNGIEIQPPRVISPMKAAEYARSRVLLIFPIIVNHKKLYGRR
jgi:hypothetical protein